MLHKVMEIAIDLVSMAALLVIMAAGFRTLLELIDLVLNSLGV